MDYLSFVSENKALVVAPAGYGKTHSIVECLKHTEGLQLILTHTHAGVASIKEKIKSENIPTSKFHIETISSFCQKYVQSFYVGDETINQEDKGYHPFVLKKACLLFKSQLLKQIIKKTYTGLFIDEYQDCTKEQHEIVMELSDVLLTRIFGDPMQSIFDFNGDVVDFETDLQSFRRFPDLEIPNRWCRNGQNILGDTIKEYRNKLVNREPVVFQDDRSNGVYVFMVNDGDLLRNTSEYNKILVDIVTNRRSNPSLESLLILVPEYEEMSADGKRYRGTISERVKLKNRIDFRNQLTLLEAIDDRSFYSIAHAADNIISGVISVKKKIKKVKNEILLAIFQKTEVNNWFLDDSFKGKRTEADKEKSKKVQAKFDAFFKVPNPHNLLLLVNEAKSQFGLKRKREAIYRNFLTSLKQSALESISVYEAMKNNRNHIRRVGRKVHKKCIGTTLLTKGLEFDTVVLVDAHKFDSPQHLYVALSRCCENLIIFTNNLQVNPY